MQPQPKPVSRAAEKNSRQVTHGWQPIATAPKDGTRIICWGPRLMVVECEWRKPWAHDKEGWYRSNQHPLVQPTHWMLLPDPPQVEESCACQDPVNIRNGLKCLKHMEGT